MLKLNLQRFAPQLGNLQINFDSHIKKVVATSSNWTTTHTWTTSGEEIFLGASYLQIVTFDVTLDDGYVIDNVTLNTANESTLETKNDKQFTIKCGSDILGSPITITSKKTTSQVSIDLTTLSGWEDLSDGEHTITIKAKASGYADSNASESVVVTKSSSSGETWVLNDTVDAIELQSINISFKSNNQSFTWFNVRKGYIAYSNSEEWNDTNMVYDTASWIDEAYRTITFATPPTGDLLTWLQENGTKQSGGGSVIKAGTYVIKESPTLNIDIDITLNGKMNTLTADNTYGEMTTFDNFVVVASSPVQIGGVYFTNTENEMGISYNPDAWKFFSDDEYTTTDTTKIRTIVIENDQNVTQEIKTWWDENTTNKGWVLLI